MFQSESVTQWMATLGVGGGAAFLAGMIADHIQQKRAKVFPMLPSRMERLAQQNEAIRFYAAVNDLTMVMAG